MVLVRKIMLSMAALAGVIGVGYGFDAKAVSLKCDTCNAINPGPVIEAIEALPKGALPVLKALAEDEKTSFTFSDIQTLSEKFEKEALAEILELLKEQSLIVPRPQEDLFDMYNPVKKVVKRYLQYDG